VRWDDEADYIIVGSGASGATAGVVLAEKGHSVLILEEGEWYRKEDFREDLFSAMSTLFRDFGARLSKGRSVMPILEGCCVGGSTVMNGAIVHRLPENIYGEWIAKDPAWESAIPWDALESYAAQIEKDLQIRRNVSSVLDQMPVADALRARGWAFEAMQRNAPGCESTGRCLQGCPTGGKWSMEASYIPRAQKSGARVLSGHRASKVILKNGEALGVECKTSGGTRRMRATRGVLAAAGVLHTPALLRRSGIRHPRLGHHFQCHLGIGITGRLPRPAITVEGPPQGIEISEFKGEGVKLATQLVPYDLTLSRTSLVGQSLVDELRQADHYSSWTGSIRAEAEGVLKEGWGKSALQFEPSPRDLERVRFSLWKLSQLLFDLGAERVFPGVCVPEGYPAEIRSATKVDSIMSLPLDPKFYLTSVGHLFGTCRMGSDEKDCVVDLDFRVRGTRGLYVVDASVFPSNTGVNPQHSIMSLAMHAAKQISA